MDGVAAYGSYRGWDWLSPSTWKRFYGLAMLVGLLEAALFAGLALAMS